MMRLEFIYLTLAAYALFFLYSAQATAEIIIHGTRVIYHSDAREVTLQLMNNGDQPALVQVWMDRGDASVRPELAQVPFAITPPMTRVEGGRGQALRITALANSQHLSSDQETLFWLNILDIPPKPQRNASEAQAQNYLQLAIRSRIKFIYRPKRVHGNVVDAASKMQWQYQDHQLMVSNPTPFFISVTSVEQSISGQKINLIEEGMLLAPYSKNNINLKSDNLSNMKFVLINDYGNRIEKEIKF